MKGKARSPLPRRLSRRQFIKLGGLGLTVSRTAQVTQIILIGMNAITHWMDGGVPRRLSLPFQQSGSQVTVQIPAEPVVAMPGFYLLFALVDDIPSEGLIVQLT